MVAALLLTAVINGRAGLKALLARVVRWRVNLRWYGVALLLPVTLGLSAFGLNLLLGAPIGTSTMNMSKVAQETGRNEQHNDKNEIQKGTCAIRSARILRS